jgi:hypothetical protein
MSAWTVSKVHIDVLVRGLIENGGYEHRGAHVPVTVDNASEVGQMLWRENFRSVNYRYNERKSTPPYSYQTPEQFIITSHHRGDTRYLELQQYLNPGLLAKQLHCYNYQSCEHEVYSKSRARSVVLSLGYAVSSSVEGYDAAEWGV